MPLAHLLNDALTRPGWGIIRNSVVGDCSEGISSDCVRSQGCLDGTTLVSRRLRRGLRRPKLYALVWVLILAAISAHGVVRDPESYLESGLVVLSTQKASAAIYNPYSTVGQSLITTSAAMVESLTSPQSQTLVRKAGGAAEFSLTLVNFYNQDYPEYADPLATLTAQSADPVAAHRTFKAVLDVLRRLLAERQVGVRPLDRVSIQVVGDTGPVIQAGSLKRSLAAFGLLTVIAVGMLTRFFDRHQSLLTRLPSQYLAYWRFSNQVASHRMPRGGRSR